MAQDTYTEVTTQSWGSRIRGSLKGIIGGFVLLAVGVSLLFWNEGRAVRRTRALTEGGEVVVSVPTEQVNPANEGRLVHLSGPAETSEVLRDTTFGVAVGAIHLDREVEMYQWRESEKRSERKKLGGGTETTTTYSYSKGWSSSLNNSNSFKQPAGHENPSSMPYKSTRLSASDVRVGPFQLSRGLIHSMSRSEALRVESLDRVPQNLRVNARLDDGRLYIGRSPGSPEIGDLRVSFSVVRPATVSVVARQEGERLESYTTSKGGSIALLSYGAVTADAMFEAAHKANRVMTWVLRVLGFFLIAFGLKTVFRPLSVLADVVPAIGRVVEASTGFVAFLLAGFVWLIVVAVAWLYHRPVLAVILLLLAGGLFVVSVRAIARRVKRNKEIPPPPPPPPPVPESAGPVPADTEGADS